MLVVSLQSTVVTFMKVCFVYVENVACLLVSFQCSTKPPSDLEYDLFAIRNYLPENAGFLRFEIICPNQLLSCILLALLVPGPKRLFREHDLADFAGDHRERSQARAPR